MKKWTRTHPPFRILLLWRILALLVLVSLVPMAATGFILKAVTREQLTTAAQHDMGLQAEKAVAEITALVDKHQSILRSVASQPAITSMRKEEQLPVLDSTKQANPDFSTLMALDTSGVPVARADYALFAKYDDREYFKAALKGDEVAYQIVTSKTTGKPALAIAVPIRRGTVVGVLVGKIDLDKMAAFLNQLHIGKTGYAWLVDQENRVMSYPDEQMVKQREKMTTHPAIAHLGAGHSGAISFTEGGKEWLGVTQVTAQGWVLVAQMEQTEAMATVAELNKLFPLLMAGAAALLLFLSGLAARDLIKPIRAMAKFAGVLADGDLSASLTITRSDELGEMADSLRHMQSNLRGHVAAVQKSAGRMAITAGDLGVAIAVAADSGKIVTNAFDRTRNEVEELTSQQRERLDATKAVVTELTNAVEQIAETAASQAGEVSQAAAVVSSVAHQAEMVVGGIDRVSEAAKQVEIVAGAVRMKVNGAVAGIGTTQASVDLGADAMRQLGRRAGAMSKILQEISGLAGQTNQLAANVSKGHAEKSVASDLRRLADQSAMLAQESASLLAQMQEEIQQAVQMIAEGEAAVRRGTDQVKEAEWSLAQIQQVVQATIQETAQMRSAVNALSDGHTQLSRSMEMLAAVAEENSAAAEEMAAGAETARGQVQELDTLALQNFASIQAVVPEMKSINRAIGQVVETINRLEAIKTELVESTASLKA